ncbi:hypothetical protein [Ruegeria arenilitoris]|uniref:hypothetical protein n=1 Tax=Ruegeria arenilitoris TaxID=1173585 RepID=UPI00147A23D3|nr:hypothetical protein [Ruegeria arenilitoris]
MAEKLSSSSLSELGLKATWVYMIILIGGLPLAATFGFIKLAPLELNEVGDFLAGAFGPLAIFWLVLGFFQQGKELRASVEALKLQAEELKNSVDQQKAMVGVTQQQLKIDEAAFKENSFLRQEAEMPHLVVSQNGGITSGKSRQYKYKIKNIGKPAARIVLSTSPQLEQIFPTEFLALSSEETVEFHIDFNSDTLQEDFNRAHELVLISDNQMGRTKTQIFQILKTEVTPIRSYIESVEQ